MAAARSRSEESAVRVALRVKPGASRTRVGGAYGDAGALVVAVTERAVGGKATAAALKALAKAVGVPASAVSLLVGAASRDKVVQIAAPPPDITERLDSLRKRDF